MRRGFTLIELMVVIAIIAILAAIMVPTIRSTSKKADETSAGNVVHSLSTAIDAYVTEYGHLPMFTSGGEVVANGASIPGEDKVITSPQQLKLLMLVLGAYDPEMDSDVTGMSAHVLANLRERVNPRAISFYTMEGEEYKSATPLDPWGNIYYIYFDANHDGRITIEHLGEPVVYRGNAIVMSTGSDQQIVPPTSHIDYDSDNIYSCTID